MPAAASSHGYSTSIGKVADHDGIIRPLLQCDAQPRRGQGKRHAGSRP
jgi:hypothetical protein